MTTIAYQGEPGAFSDDAARTLVPGAETRGFPTFDEAAGGLQHGATALALLPVENSISGSVPRVYDLLWSAPELRIVDEIVYRVVQNLVALPGATLAGLREVRSHPVALEQCRGFFETHPELAPRIVADTAGAVREVVAAGDPALGAIASALAAERYGAYVLEPAIQDVADNFTRFFLLARNPEPRPQPTRACIALVLENRPGSLRDALTVFADRGLDLRTLVSRPSLERPFTYRFYCEIASVSAKDLGATLAALHGTARILGHY
ncbi:MAG: prephenate dehydratase [Vulcanimicrobiaceae bacterium]